MTRLASQAGQVKDALRDLTGRGSSPEQITATLAVYLDGHPGDQTAAQVLADYLRRRGVTARLAMTKYGLRVGPPGHVATETVTLPRFVDRWATAWDRGDRRQQLTLPGL